MGCCPRETIVSIQGYQNSCSKIQGQNLEEDLWTGGFSRTRYPGYGDVPDGVGISRCDGINRRNIALLNNCMIPLTREIGSICQQRGSHTIIDVGIIIRRIITRFEGIGERHLHMSPNSRYRYPEKHRHGP